MISFVHDDGCLLAEVPNFPSFGPLAAELGGVVKSIFPWTWSFPLELESDVRALCRRVYGHDGMPGETVTCRVAVPDDGRMTLWGLGRLLAERSFCPEPVKLGEGVSLLRGSFANFGLHRGPPARLPSLEPNEAVLEVANVPAELARREAAASGGTIDVVGETDVAAVEALMAVVRQYGEALGYVPPMEVEPPGDRSVATLAAGFSVYARAYPGSFLLLPGDLVPRSELVAIAKFILRETFIRALDDLEAP